jgi:hypothetical protein
MTISEPVPIVRRIRNVVIFICAVILLVPVSWLIIVAVTMGIDTVRTDQFYRAHPILQAMKSAQGGTWSNDSEPAREVLLHYLPLGTDRVVALAAAKREGFGCQNTSWPSDELSRRGQGFEHVEMKGQLVDCQRQSPAPLGYTHWIVDMWFDDENRLLGAKVAIWGMFL